MDAGFGYAELTQQEDERFVIKGDARRVEILEKQKLVVVALNNGQTQVFEYK